MTLHTAVMRGVGSTPRHMLHNCIPSGTPQKHGTLLDDNTGENPQAHAVYVQPDREASHDRSSAGCFQTTHRYSWIAVFISNLRKSGCMLCSGDLEVPLVRASITWSIRLPAVTANGGAHTRGA
jgi:hypothetical protein